MRAPRDALVAALVGLAVAAVLGCAAKGSDDVQSAPVQAMTIDADLLRTWSEKLCRMPAGDAAATASALGITGQVAAQGDYATVEPPPPGTSKLMLVKGEGGIGHLDIMLSGRALTRADLDARFGKGNLLPRVSAGRPYRVAYHVAVAGAPFTCEVIASFTEEPGDATAAAEVVLRRDRA
jgi:hypothetical protein